MAFYEIKVHISGFYICLPNKEDNQLIQLAELDFETKFNTTKFSNNDDDDDYFFESTSVNKKYHISSQSEAEFSNGSTLSNTSTDTQR
ncbi:unnamed protein product [Rhizophagus irregularis]|nr:unnamed protein product [Rhizophagus irregularis]